MSRKQTRRKCRCCKKFFLTDYRNGNRQRFCSQPDCRGASKKASQRRWLRQPANRDYFRGPRQVQRVQDWRKEHPGYWRKTKSSSQGTQVVEPQPISSEQRSCNAPRSDLNALQDRCFIQHPAFVGLISMITGSTLQDDIAATSRQLLIRGQNILGLKVPETEPKPSTSTPLYD